MASPDYCAALVRERDLDRYLATLYAPAPARAGLMALHALDLEIADVERTTTEPMLGQIRLAWWREQLQALDGGARPAQPVLAALAEHVLPLGVSGGSLEPLEDANLALLADDFAAYAAARATLFGAGLRLLLPSADQALIDRAHLLGRGWAFVDAARRGRTLSADLLEEAQDALQPVTAPAPARSLLALGRLARADLAELRAGRVPGPRGTPGRQARLLWSIVTGR